MTGKPSARTARADRTTSRSGRNPGGRTPKSEETRRALLDAAARLFAEHGYHETSVPDIVQAAGVGHGTFYEYFASRRDILLALTRPVTDARERRRPSLTSRNLADRIRAEIFWYLSDHVEHLALSKVWHAASNFDPEIADTRRRERARRIERVRRGIESAEVRPDIDPGIAAAALVAMLEEFTHRWFIDGDGPGRSAHDVVTAAETLGTLWLSAIGLAG
jgi:AcrR family transcriptional regulator